MCVRTPSPNVRMVVGPNVRSQVLGDRSMKYRYLNPNTVVVVTGAPPGGDDEGDGATM